MHLPSLAQPQDEKTPPSLVVTIEEEGVFSCKEKRIYQLRSSYPSSVMTICTSH